MADDPGRTYYEGPDLERIVFDALGAAGRPSDRIDPDDLAGLDEFHALGRAATLALAALADIRPGERVLDVGAGIGGPSRTLARHYGAKVTALDPTERFCGLSRAICERAGLESSVEVVRGDARDMPFDDGSFDVVWTQSVLQSIDDKAAVADEVRRVLAPGGRYVLFEVVAGPGGDLHYPVPWADGPAESFLVEIDELRSLLSAAGLREDVWREMAEVQAGIQQALDDSHRMSSGVPGVGLDLVLPDFDARMAALGRNVGEQRIALVQARLDQR
jgi:SAM-dependent methyltransferase